MSIFIVARTKCARDQVCVRVCPLGVLEPDADGYPGSRRARELGCIRCGHCIAACPHGALSLADLPVESCESIPAGPNLTPEQAARFFKARRSVREFQDQPVSRDVLIRLLDIVRYAPTAKNTQPVHWLMVESREEVRRLAQMAVEWVRASNSFPGIAAAWDRGRDMVLRGAPALAIAHAAPGMFPPSTDCVIALTHLELAATAFGLGGCWAGIFHVACAQHPPLRDALRLPEGHSVYGAMMLGYPQFHYHRLPPRQAAPVEWR